MSEVTAAEAMARANEAHLLIAAHEDICAERYGNIHTALGDLKSIVAWGGSGLIVLLITVLGFFMARTMTNNDSQVAELKAQVAIMTAQQAPHPK